MYILYVYVIICMYVCMYVLIYIYIYIIWKMTYLADDTNIFRKDTNDIDK